MSFARSVLSHPQQRKEKVRYNFYTNSHWCSAHIGEYFMSHYISQVFGIRKSESLGYCMALFPRDPMSNRFGTIPTCDRHSDTQVVEWPSGSVVGLDQRS